MAFALLYELLHSSSNWGSEQKNTSDRVVELDWLFDNLETFDEVSGFPVSSKLGIVSVEVADSISDFEITIPSQVLLDWLFTGSVCLFGHDGVFGIDGVLAGSGSCSKSSSQKFEHLSLASRFSYELDRWSHESSRRVEGR